MAQGHRIDYGLIKRQVNLADVVRSSGREVEKNGSGEEWIALCPFHNDRNHPNLTIYLDKDGWRFKCFTCGESGDVFDWVKKINKIENDRHIVDFLQASHGAPASNGSAAPVKSNGRKPGGKKKPEWVDWPVKGQWIYQNADRSPNIKIVRHDKPDGSGTKALVPHAPEGKGWTSYSKVPANHVPVIYRLPDVLEAIAAGRTIYLVEGEKCADIFVIGLDLDATCHEGGTKRLEYRKDALQALAGADVVVMRDRDKPGRIWARGVRDILQPIAKSLRFVESGSLRDMSNPDDAHDIEEHLAAGLSVEQLVEVDPDAHEPGDDEGEAPEDDQGEPERCPYEIKDGRICHWEIVNRKEGTKELKPLCNFVARIVEDLTIDDGAEQLKFFKIEAKVSNHAPDTFDVPANKFASMTWVLESVGASAYLNAGLSVKDHARCAIQMLSGKVPVSTVFAHTGWKEVDGKHLYLTAAGAIGVDGLISDLKVDLARGGLSKFSIGEPRLTAKEGADVLLGLLDLAPLEVTAPLLGAMVLAPLIELLPGEEPDLVYWFHGPSGVFKSELAALAQSGWGDFTAKGLPGSFVSTANSIERQWHAAKDALMVFDDNFPTDDKKESSDLMRITSKLLRGVGNRKGRGRMRADTTLKAELFPRCIALVTAEKLPTGHSNMARMFAVDIRPGSVDKAKLTDAQTNRHLIREGMFHYLRYIAKHFEELSTTLRSDFYEIRNQITNQGHARQASQIAYTGLAIDVFLNFAVEHGAVDGKQRSALMREILTNLTKLADEQAQLLEGEAPHQLFLKYLREALATGQAYLLSQDGGQPDDPDQWGWEYRKDDSSSGLPIYQRRPNSHHIGVVTATHLELIPGAVHTLLNSMASGQGRIFPLDEQSLWKRLDEREMIEVYIEGGKIRRRTVNTRWKDRPKQFKVLKLKREAYDAQV